MNQTVSVVIPSYNSGKYIRESIDSVLNQTYSDYEIIVVDDGSTDNTKCIINEHFPNVRYISQVNGGAAKARNTGIKEAKGEFIAFIDTDDIWQPTKLARQIEHFREHPEVGLVFTENSLFDSQGVIEHTTGKRESLMKGDIIKNIFHNSGVTTSTVMVRRTVLEDVGMFEEGLITGEDDNLWLRIGMKYRIDLIDEPLVRYRVTENSLSRTEGNIFRGVKRHLELLDTKYIELKKRLDNLIEKKHSVLHFSNGYGHFSRYEMSDARKEFKTSLRYWKFNHKSLLYLFCSFLPPAVITFIKQMKWTLKR